MATLDNDILVFEDDQGRRLGQLGCKDAGIDWPPPVQINAVNPVTGQRQRWELQSFSQLSDSVADHPNLARGALYRPAND